MKVEELIEKFSTPEFKKNFTLFYGIKYFLNNCIISKDYDFTAISSESIVLTEAGDKLFGQLFEGKYSNVDPKIIKLAVFLEFYNYELLVNVTESNYELLSKSVSEEIIKGNILFPWIYGRTLYDKFFEQFEEQEDVLEIEKVLKLLEDTPKGVFQMGNQIIGPLGILHSENKRIIPATTFVKLWHCSDPSCEALHSVKLKSARTIISELLFEISELTQKVEESEWDIFYKRMCDVENSYYNDKRNDDIPITLVYSFGGNELRFILKEIIDNLKGAREIIPKGKKFQGSSDQIINGLTKAECFQLILLFNSIEILELTEKLIAERKIYIPSTEIRKSTLQKSGGFFSIYHECNRLGFRAVSRTTHLSFLHLRNLILKLYDEPSLKQQLEWHLRFYDNESLREKVETYINSEEPRKILKEVVLNSAYQVTKTFEYLFGYFKMPKSIEEEEQLIDKILWKLGFDINIYPSILPTFEIRLTKFRKIIEATSVYGEADKEKIRSAAVNLFVSLEEVLKHTLSFTTWLLLSDHLKETRFRYNYSEATLFMTQILNGYKLNDETVLTFDANGRNTLFPLIEGFTALFGTCDKYLNELRNENLRDVSELPRFIGKTELIDFPLLHKKLVFDIKQSSYQKIKQIGIQIPQEFNRSKVLSVRNALEHDREEFPLKQELIIACDCMRNSINEIYESGLFPNVFLFNSLSKDKHNRVLKTFEDYNGKKITIPELINYKGYPIPSSDSPLVIVPTITFLGTTEPLRIGYEENSEYLFYWRNYPRKKAKLKSKELEKEND
ncbi:MAG: hypothetical protein PHT69_11320 [Bacteroidales bacterium]|nr:hypothetical protein [Bacteroidales bacterium]